MGRGTSKGFGTCCVAQRPDASYYPGGCRSSFMILLHMGRTNSEDRRMLGLDKPEKDYRTGQGIVWADGYPPRDILIPHIADMDRLIYGVRKHLNGMW